MRLADLQYDLPPELIAQQPREPRDASRLLVLHRSDGRIEHCVFRDIGEYLQPGDCLVLNDTRVIPARFFCRRQTGGKVEALFLRQEGDAWRVMLRPSSRLKIGESLACEGDGTTLVIDERQQRGEWRVRPQPAVEPLDLLGRIGQTPLPPYIQRQQPTAADALRYQTVYAERPGAVAAPTAGLHFTDDLLERLAGRGVRRADITLHVGAGTFVPIQTEDLAEHQMHAEWFELSAAAAGRLRETRSAGGHVVAVGTTSVRTLESLPTEALTTARPSAGWTDIFIYPPYRFRHVDSLITNFHLPGSTLLALVMALASPELIRDAYRQAVQRGYRFYSFGDAMLIV